MSDKVKLIIEIPKDIYERCKEYKLWSYDAETLEGAVATSKPLSENKGEWITDETSGSALNDRYYCSNCGKELKMPYTVIKAEQKNGKYLFCDRCGADMRGE